MKSFALLATAALAATAIAIPVEAKAKTYADTLRAHGVTADFIERCRGNLQASYTPKTRHIRLCLDGMKKADDVGQALRHETIHAIQHCIAMKLEKPGLMPIADVIDYSDRKLANKLRSEVRNHVYRKYSSSLSGSNEFNGGMNPALEEEAYALQDMWSNKQTLEIFAASCG